MATDNNTGKLGSRLVRSFAVKESSPPPVQSSQQQPSRADCPSTGAGTDQPPTPQNAGINLKEFLRETVNRSAKDCNLLFKLEETIVDFIRNERADEEGRSSHPLPPMSSYQRMLAHRLAAYYNLEHNLDPSGQSVVISYVAKPDFPSEALQDLRCVPNRILRREFSEKEKTRVKQRSLEERHADYYNVRRKIFEEETGDVEQQQPWTTCPEKRILKVNSLDQPNQSKEPISKSYSFGGLGSGGSEAGRKLGAKQQGFGTSTSSVYSNSLSPASSGYKSQSFELQLSTISPSQTPPPPKTVNNLTQQLQATSLSSTQLNGVLWAVTDLASVPSGAVLIDPATGKPILNPDGSIYKFDAGNPPIIQYHQPPQYYQPDYTPDYSGAPYVHMSNYPNQMLHIIQAPPASQHPMYHQQQQQSPAPAQILYPAAPAPSIQFPIEIYNIRGSYPPPSYAPRQILYNRSTYTNQQQMEQLLLAQLHTAEYTSPVLIQNHVQHPVQQGQGRRYWGPGGPQQYYGRR